MGARGSVHVALAFAFGVLVLAQGWIGQLRAWVVATTDPRAAGSAKGK